MNLALDIIITITLVTAFCVSHSYLASNKVKLAFQQRFGSLIAFYRLGYNVISIVSFIIIYLFFPKIDFVVYDLPNPFDLIILFLQMLSFLGLLWCAKYFNGLEFLGLSQIRRYLNGSYNQNDIDEKSEFRIEGPYKYSRHPVYFFSIMFLLMRSFMGLTYLIIVVIFIFYFYIGSVFEEKRLVEKFGEAYINYQKTVPRIFPIKINKA